jgi:hypothetical protein
MLRLTVRCLSSAAQLGQQRTSWPRIPSNICMFEADIASIKVIYLQCITTGRKAAVSFEALRQRIINWMSRFLSRFVATPSWDAIAGLPLAIRSVLRRFFHRTDKIRFDLIQYI